MSDPEQLTRSDFLRALFPPEIDGLIETRQIHVSGKPVQRDWHPSAEELEILAPFDHYNVYFSAVTRRDRRGRKADARTVYFLYADIDFYPDDVDGMSLEETAEHAAARQKKADRDLKALTLKPTLIVFTGGGYHVYWGLDQPFSILGDEGDQDATKVARTEQILRGIASRLGADRSVAEVAHVLRLPDTLNHPGKTKQKKGRTEPVRAFVVECSSERKYTIEHLEASFSRLIDLAPDQRGTRAGGRTNRERFVGGDARDRRWSRERPCPVCGGDQLTKGAGRCYGMLSPDGRTAYCTADAGGGRIQQSSTYLDSYPHALGHECRCGSDHGAAFTVESGTAPLDGEDPVAPVVGKNQFESSDAIHAVAVGLKVDGCTYARHFDYWDDADDAEPRLRVYRYEDGEGEKQIKQVSRRSDGTWQFSAQGAGRLVYNLAEVRRAVRNGEVIWIVEGEKDADRLAELGLVSTTFSQGAVTNAASIHHLLNIFIGARVVVVPDHDESGRTHARNVLAAIDPFVMSSRCRAPRDEADTCDSIDQHGLDWWEEFDVQDLHDDRRARRGRLALQRLLVGDEDEAGLPPVDQGLLDVRAGRRIRIRADRDFRAASVALANALAARNSHETKLFVVGTELRQIGGARYRGRLGFASVSAPDQRKLAEDVAMFERLTREGHLRECSPNRDLVGAAFSRLRDELDECVGITWDPLMHGDGSLVAESGYDETSRLLVCEDPDLDLTAVPTRPTASQIEHAREEIEDVLCDVVFASHSDKANLIAFIFTIVLRHLIDGPTPLLVVHSPKPGTGKSEAIKIIGMLGTGTIAAMASPPKNEEELQKLLFSYCLAGRSLVVFDNWKGEIDSETIAAYATSSRVSGRILGVSEAPELETRMVMSFTGNNISVSREIERRSIFVRLDAMKARPEEREFTYPDICEHIRESRGRLLAAVFTIARAGLQAEGESRVAFPGYPAWSRVVGPILEAGGWTEFGQGREEMRDDLADEDTVWFWFLAWLYERWQKAPSGFTAEELADFLKPQQAFNGSFPRPESVATPLADESAKDGRPDLPRDLGERLHDHRGLGYFLRGVRDAVREGPDGSAYRLVRATAHNGRAANWKVEEVSQER